MSEIDFESLFNLNTIKLKDQIINKKLNVNSFRIIKTKLGVSYLCYDDKHKRLFFANSQLKAYLNKLQHDLKIDNGFYYKENELNNIVEFKIKAIKEDTKQVELEIIKHKKTNNIVNEILPLSDSEEIDNDIPVKFNLKNSNGNPLKNNHKIIENLTHEIKNDIINNLLKNK